jgi:hypothetical protein
MDELIIAVICSSMLGSARIDERRSTMPPSGKCERNGESKKENAYYQAPDRARPSVLGAPFDRLRARGWD